VVQPKTLPISRVASPSAAIRTMRARSRIRTSVFVERTSASSTVRSSTVSVIAVAQGTVRIHSLNHDSPSNDSGY
jgi:hypothetical protein